MVHRHCNLRLTLFCLISIHFTFLVIQFFSPKDPPACGSPELGSCVGELDSRGVCARNRMVNAYVIDYDVTLMTSVFRLVDQKLAPDHPDVSDVIRQLMDPPSLHMRKTSMNLRQTPQSTEIIARSRGKKHGFFVECGALDGERSSNTIILEQHYDWSGLLVEVDPYFYTQLRGKNRKAYSINACLSTSSHPAMLNFRESRKGSGEIVEDETDRTSLVPCFPLESMLLALGQTTVDYFSLDVEGQELNILKTIPFDRIDIQMLSVEYAHLNDSQEMVSFMAGVGYEVVNDMVLNDEALHLYVMDYIFIKKLVK